MLTTKKLPEEGANPYALPKGSAAIFHYKEEGKECNKSPWHAAGDDCEQSPRTLLLLSFRAF